MAEERPNALTCKVGSDCKVPPELDFAHPSPTGPYVPPEQCIGDLDLSTSECAAQDAEYIAQLQAEALNIAAGPVNVFPLLGVNNQGSNIDMTGNGFPISSGTPSGYNALDAFNVNSASWRSIQQGADVVMTPAYLGYDFGTKKAWEKIGPPQERYQEPQAIRKQVRSFKIKQGDDPRNRAVQARVEASDDGLSWIRIDVVSLPDTGELTTVFIKQSAIYRMWRLVPTFFAGVAANMQWEVVQLQLLDVHSISIDDVQDPILLENRDRAYCRSSTFIKAQYDLLDVQTELAKFGINLPKTYTFTVSFAQMVSALGRKIIVGDLLELPGEMQYDHHNMPVRQWLEVTDTSWATEGYTFDWRPQLYKFYAQPVLPSVEHREILGLPQQRSARTDDEFLSGNFQLNTQALDVLENVKQDSKDAVPQSGGDPQDIQSGLHIYGDPQKSDNQGIYAEDAIPQNGQPYTIGDRLPEPSTLVDGAYHRQTYTYLPKSLQPPARLLKWGAERGRWQVVEINKRIQPESHKQTASKMLGSPGRTDIDKKF